MPAKPRRRLLGYLLFVTILAGLLVNELRQGEIAEIVARISPFVAPPQIESPANGSATGPVVVENHTATEITLPPDVVTLKPDQNPLEGTLPSGEIVADAGNIAADDFESAGADGGRSRSRGAATGLIGGGSGGGLGGAGGFGGGIANSGDEGSASFFLVSNDNANTSLPNEFPPALPAVSDSLPDGTGGMPDVSSNPFTVVGNNGNDLKPSDVDSQRDETNEGGNDPKPNPAQWHAVPENTSVMGLVAFIVLCFVGLRRRVLP